MADWFRSWHGAPSDPKWRMIARRADAPISLVVATVWELLDRASRSEIRGSISGLDAESIACAFDAPTSQVEAIVEAMRSKGILVGDRFAAWERRQPKREDENAAERVREFRKRNDNRTIRREYKVKRDETQVKRDETRPSESKRVETHEPDLKRDETLDKSREDSVPSGTGAVAPAIHDKKSEYSTPKHELWGEGRPMLEELGVSKDQAGKMMGKWLKETGDNHAGVLDAIARARDSKPVDPIAWITRALPSKVNGNVVSKPHTVQQAARALERAFATFGQAPPAPLLPGGGLIEGEPVVRMLPPGRG